MEMEMEMEIAVDSNIKRISHRIQCIVNSTSPLGQ